jgi:hypothetical protein
MRSIPPQHQTDPSKLPGQIVNQPSWDTQGQEDMMDDMALHAFMNPKPKPQPDSTLGDYIRRKDDNHAGMPVTPGEALCSRIMR